MYSGRVDERQENEDTTQESTRDFSLDVGERAEADGASDGHTAQELTETTELILLTLFPLLPPVIFPRSIKKLFLSHPYGHIGLENES